MTVASTAVAMAVMTEARAVDVEKEGHTSSAVCIQEEKTRHCAHNPFLQ
jgi:hypothetical protein